MIGSCARLLLLAVAISAAGDSPKSLTQVYSNNDFQITGVTVSNSGRLFVNFPRWSDQYQNAVMEVKKDGSAQPFPDEYWNRWDKTPALAGKQFVCVQSVVVDSNDTLWVLDPASPLITTVVPGGAKLVSISLSTNKVTRVYSFGPDIAKPNSYLNDIRIDTARNTAYITDSGVGGIVVLDIQSGQAHRALDGHPSVQPETGVSISVNGKPVVGPTGKPPQFASDGIALSRDGNYLYYQALTGATLYRVKTSALRQGANTGAAVERVAKTFPVDGLWIDKQDRVYLSNINESAVYRMEKGGSLQKVASDSRLEWPDTFSQGPDGAIYITASHINDGPQFNHGKSTRKLPYTVFKFLP